MRSADLVFLYEPILVLALLAALVLLLRWTFSRGHSLVPSAPRRGREHEYGLLVPVAAPSTFIEAELVRQQLVEHHIRATLAPTTDGPRVLVFPEEEQVARAVLRRPHHAPGT